MRSQLYSSAACRCGVLPPEQRHEPKGAASSKQFLNSVVTRVRFAVPAKTVWKNLMFYEEIEKRPPWLLRLLLPIPVRANGHAKVIGDELKCCYQNGYLTKRVTQITQDRSYRFEVVEQDLALPRGITLIQGSYTLRELPGGCAEVSLETRYLSENRPRWLCRRIEAAVCHLFHLHILSAIGGNLSFLNRRETE